MASPHPPILRVGMVALTNPDDPNPLSGMPYRMASALRAHGVDLVPIIARAQDTPQGLRQRIAHAYKRRSPASVKRLLDDAFPARTADAARAKSVALERSIHEQLAALEHPVDLLFGACISTPLAALETDLPIVYFSDATSIIINSTYPRFGNRGRALLDARVETERAALARATLAAFASPAARNSAVSHLGLDPARASVIPMGAHITPVDPTTVTAPANAPTARDCRLVIVAADPVRKRVDLAVRAAETLRRMGIHATLSVIGPGTRAAHRSPAVDFCQPLRLSNEDDAHRHRAILRDAHLQLLPSLGEAFGIAPCESAHFARPSIVADTGGLPHAVLHDDTGIVLPVNADHRVWADTVARIVNDPDRYRNYSRNAVARARTQLNWPAWAASIITLMRRATADTTTRSAHSTGPSSLAG